MQFLAEHHAIDRVTAATADRVGVGQADQPELGGVAVQRSW